MYGGLGRRERRRVAPPAVPIEVVLAGGSSRLPELVAGVSKRERRHPLDGNGWWCHAVARQAHRSPGQE